MCFDNSTFGNTSLHFGNFSKAKFKKKSPKINRGTLIVTHLNSLNY